jgi:hypothetical protein
MGFVLHVIWSGSALGILSYNGYFRKQSINILGIKELIAKIKDWEPKYPPIIGNQKTENSNMT